MLGHMPVFEQIEGIPANDKLCRNMMTGCLRLAHHETACHNAIVGFLFT